jgi:hypothetical protein
MNSMQYMAHSEFFPCPFISNDTDVAVLILIVSAVLSKFEVCEFQEEDTVSCRFLTFYVLVVVKDRKVLYI